MTKERLKLEADAKIYIVQRLACFDSPSQVAKAIKEDMGLDVSPQACEGYDPTKVCGSGLSQKLREVFEQTRQKFLNDTTQIAVSHRAFRLRALERMAKRAEEKGNMVLAASLLEQAAKECGGSYTNQRTVEARLATPLGSIDSDTIKRMAGEICRA